MFKKLLFTLLILGPFLAVLGLALWWTGLDLRLRRGATVALGNGGPPPGHDPLVYFAICDPKLGWRNRPNGRYNAWYFEGNPLVTTDASGFRNGGLAGDPVVCFVGDSYTFCSEVNDDETGPAEVSKLLGVPVLNAGVRGYSTLQCKRMLAECLDRFPSLRVAVYTYCGNDIEENIVQDLRYPSKAPWMKREGERFVEVELQSPTVPWATGFSNWKGDPTKIISQKDYWAKVAWAREHGAVDCLVQLLQEMDQLCERHGVRFLAIGAETGGGREVNREFAEVCRRARIRNVDVREAFPGGVDRWTAKRTDDVLDLHYGPEGTKEYTRVLGPAVRKLLE